MLRNCEIQQPDRNHSKNCDQNGYEKYRLLKFKKIRKTTCWKPDPAISSV